MKLKIKIWHWIIFLILVLIIYRASLLIDCLNFTINFAGLLFSEFKSASQVFDFDSLEIILTPVILILIAYFIFKYKSSKILSASLKFTPAVSVLFLFVFLFSSVITNRNPGFQKDLSITRLLPPLSKITTLVKSDFIQSNQSPINNVIRIKQKIIPLSFNDSIIHADSVSSDGKIYYKGTTEFLVSTFAKQNSTVMIQSTVFLLGTDEYGRDILTRLIFGTRISLLVGLSAVFLSFVIGIFLGFISAYSGGLLDIILNRFTEAMLAFPVIYLVILILALFGSSLVTVIFVLGLSGWMSLFKIVRSEILTLKKKDYMITASLLGLSRKQILLKEVFPVIIIPVMVNIVFQFSNVILAESALSYLGLTVGGYPSWGSMIESGQEYLRIAWWLIVFPGAVLILTLFCFNSFGRKINEYFIPRIK